MTDETTARLAHLREALAAHEGYGNGDTPAAAAIRAEIGLIEAQVEAEQARRHLAEARTEAAQQLRKKGK